MLVACSTAPAVSVTTKHDVAATTQLRGYQTYRLLPAPNYGDVDEVAMRRAVLRSLDETLSSKGYRQEAGRPDFFVKWHVAIAGASRSTPMMSGPNSRDVRPLPSAGTSSAPPLATTRQDKEATLILDVVDAGSNTVVWRGSGQTE